MSLTALAFWLVYGTGLCAALARPIVGAMIYILVYHLNPEEQWWGASVRQLGVRTSLLAAGATVIGVLLREPHFALSGRQLTVPIRLMLLFAVFAIASLGWGPPAGERSYVQIEKFTKVLLFVVLLASCVRTPTHFHLLVLSWVAGVFYIGYQAGGGVGLYAGGRLTGGLGGSDFAESSGLAAHLVASLPLVGALAFVARRWWSRGAILIIGALAVNTIFLTRTRSALFGFAALLVVGAFSLPPRHRAKGLLAIALGSLLSIQLADPGWWRRMQTLQDFREDASATARLQYWSAAVAMAADYPLGIGVGKFHQTVDQYVEGLAIERSAHSTFMTCLAELGWPGLLLFLIVVGISMRRMGWIIRRLPLSRDALDIHIWRWRTRFHFGWYAMALRTAIAGYLACGLFTTRLFAADLWMLLGLAACLHRLARESALADDLAQAESAPAAALPAAPTALLGAAR